MIHGQDVPRGFVDSVYNQFKRLALNIYREELGVFHKSFATKHGQALGEILGREGVKLYNFTAANVKAFVDYYNAKIIGSMSRNAQQAGHDKLKSYSNWLFSFKSSQQDEVS
jgi:hypothetical protein